MRKCIEKLENIFAAVSFAEQGEWDDAVKLAAGAHKYSAADGKKIQLEKKTKKRAVDNRPQILL